MFTRGLTVIQALPLWEGFDEWLHYSYVTYITRTLSIPSFNQYSVPREVVDSLMIAPGDSVSGGHLTFKAYWELSDEERAAARTALFGLMNDDRSQFVRASWQAQHPPLYYFVLSPVRKLLSEKSLIQSLFILRLATLLIVCLGLIPSYFLFRRFFDSRTSAIGLMFIALYPATFIRFGPLCNDALAFPLLTAFVLWLLAYPRKESSALLSLGGGLLFGLGIITKLYVLTALPAILFVYVLKAAQKDGLLKSALFFILFMAGAFILAGPWLILNIERYGTWNATIQAVVSKDMSLGQKFSAALSVDWKSFWISNVIGLLWAGNWSFVTFPSYIYKYFSAALAVLSLAGIFAFWKTRRHPDFTEKSILALVCAGFLMGLMQFQVNLQACGVTDPAPGWYWTVLLPVHFCLLGLVLSYYFGAKTRHVLLGLTFCSGFLSAWGTIGYLFPYYGGLLDKSVLSNHFFHAFSLSESVARLQAMNFVPIPLAWTLAAELCLWAALAGTHLWTPE